MVTIPRITIVRNSDATDEDYALAEKLVSYKDAQIQPTDPQCWHIISAWVSHDAISVLSIDGYRETDTMEQARDYISNVNYARNFHTGAYY